MTQKEINDYNRRCAEFLGMYDYSKDNDYFEKGKYYCYPKKEKNPDSGYYTIIQNTSNGYVGVFNSDWNWIMEVVEAIEKLESIGKTSIQYYTLLSGVGCYKIQVGRDSEDNKYPDSFPIEVTEFISENTNKTKKEAVVQAINQFLIKP